MAYQAVLVIHRADQDEFEPLDGHQEDEAGKGWWDMRKESQLRPRVPLCDVPNDYLCEILCLPVGQLLFKPEPWNWEDWTRLLDVFIEQYPSHLASVVMCHS